MTRDDDDDDDELTLRDIANEVADIGRAVDGLLKREQRRDAAERQQRSRASRADGAGLEPSAPSRADVSVRLADQPPAEAPTLGGMSPAKRALWAQLRANRGS